MCRQKTKQITRFVVVKYSGNGGECRLCDSWAYQPQMAHDYLVYRISNDIGNAANYGVRKVRVRVRTNEDARFWNCVSLAEGKWEFADKAKRGNM